jgi:hypothetical protein
VHWLRSIITAIPEVDIGRIAVQGQPGQKVGETPPISTNKQGVEIHIYNPSYAGGLRRIMVQS